MAAVKGGKKLINKLASIANQIKNRLGTPPHLEIGFQADAKYPDGTNVAMIAAIQNFGAPRVGIPPRPFFSNFVTNNRDAWGPGLGGMLIANNYNANRALSALGLVMADQLRAEIIKTNSPALSPTTLMLRKMKKQDPTLQFRMSYKVVQEARARVAAGKSYAGVSTKPLVQPGIAGGTMLKSVSYRVKT